MCSLPVVAGLARRQKGPEAIAPQKGPLATPGNGFLNAGDTANHHQQVVPLARGSPSLSGGAPYK